MKTEGAFDLEFRSYSPATHGIFQNILLMDGERIQKLNQPLVTFTVLLKKSLKTVLYQITPLTDRMNYCSSPINNMGWWMTLEKLLNIEVPKRAQYLRVIIMEQHYRSLNLHFLGVDTGAYTGFLYVFNREKGI
jgi:NADH-quinone oxidoreductase subunit D